MAIIGYVLLTVLGNGGKPKEAEAPLAIPETKEEEKEIGVVEIKAVLLDKGFIESDWRSGIYEDYITFKVEFTNNTDKDIRGFKGAFTFYDIFEEKIQDIMISYDKGIKAKETKIWKGELEYNQFIDSHKKLKNTDLENLQYKWETEQIIYTK